MLSLILVVLILFWVVYRLKNKKKIFPKEILVDWIRRRPPHDEPTLGLLLFICGIAFIIVTYAGMITYIKNYDKVTGGISYYQNNMAQLETQIAQLDAMIEEDESKSALEIKEIQKEKKELVSELEINKRALGKLPKQTPERLSLYKFLLYFGH